MTIYILWACIAYSNFWGTCGQVLEVDYRTQAECREELASMKSQPNFSHGFCRSKEAKK